MPSMLLSFIVKFVLYLSCEKNEINKKRPGLAHFLKKLFKLLAQTVHYSLAFRGGDSFSKAHSLYLK